MRSATVLSLIALAATALPASSGDGLDAFLAEVSRAEAALDADCAEAEAPPMGRVWLRRGPDGVEIAPADAEAAEAAAFWADAALGAKAAAETLYGQATGDGLARAAVMIETKPGGEIAVHDGGALAFGDVCATLRRMAAAFGDGGSGDPFAAARSRAAPPAPDEGPRVAVAVGGVGSTALPDAPPEGAFVRGPDGVTARILLTDDGDASLSVEAGGEASPGAHLIRIYDPADPFRPASTAALEILPGDAPRPSPTGGALAPGQSLEGVLPLDGAERITLSIEEAGRVVVASGAAADLEARLVGPDGDVIARDDDSGAGYGFALSADLRPGDYILDLSHCCGGGGPFSVSVSRE